MRRLKSLIVEVHRRSMWQVLAVYVGASWFVLQAAEHVVQRYLLPEWVYPAALLLLLIGLPVVLATAMVREEPLPSERTHTRRAPADDPATAPASERARPAAEAAERHADARPATGAAVEPAPGSDVQPAPAGGSGPGGVPALAATMRASPVAWLLTWRRALAGGVLAFAGLAVVTGFMVLRGVPRVAEARGSAGDAFAEPGWVVVADFDAVGVDADVALAVREALTVDLQQSAHANVYPRAQIVNVLGRIGEPDTARFDRELALDVAERVGAGAVLTVTVSRLGPQYVLSARALRPQLRDELFAVRAAAGQDRLLEGVETLSREVRRRFGERREEIRRSRPLPEVTTNSLEALKVYAEAVEMLARDGRADRAAALAEEAIRLDPSFAMAHRLAGVVAFNQMRIGESLNHTERAYELRDRLTEYERRHVEAVYHERRMETARAAELYESILARFPGDYRATNNLGVIRVVWIGDYDGARRSFVRALELDPYNVLFLSSALFHSAFNGDFAAADSLAGIAEAQDLGWLATRWRASRDYATAAGREASALCRSILAEPPRVVMVADDREFCASIEVGRGRVHLGLERLADVQRTYATAGNHTKLTDVVIASAAAEAVRGDTAAAADRLSRLLDRVDPEAIPEPDRFLARTNLMLMASLLERPDIVERVEAAYPPYPDPEHWLARVGGALVRASRAIADGDGDAALAALRDYDAVGFRPIQFRVFSEMLLPALANEAAGSTDSAIARFTDLTEPRNLTPPYMVMQRILLPFALRRLAELEESRGNADAAAAHYGRLLDLWSEADPELRDQVESVRRALRRLDGADY